MVVGVLDFNESLKRGLVTKAKNPRIAVFTVRRDLRRVWRCPGYELEDLIQSELGPAEFVEPDPSAAQRLEHRVSRWLSTRAQGVGPELKEDYDLFFAAPAVASDLQLLSTVRGWRRRSTVAVCFLQELWVSHLHRKLPAIQKILNQFDYVFCELHHTAEALNPLLSVPVECLPLGVDAELFYPWKSATKARVIDACAIGKMDPVTHAALCEWSEQTGRYYHYTSTSKDEFARSSAEHRQNLAQVLQRSNVFFTYMAKRESTHQRGAQEEIGPRYFEGAAAGALQIGDVLQNHPVYRDYISWDGAVIEAPYSFADMPALIEEIGRDSSWVAEQRRANVTACLLGHDHLYRWDRVMAVAGLPETSGMKARRSRLNALAASIGGGNSVALSDRVS